MAATTRPLALLAELTYRCPLKCAYCSNPLQLAQYRGELDTATWRRVLSEAAELGVVQIHFSGGEPLVRRDLVQLVRHARELDLYSNLSTGATMADEAALDGLKEAGLDALQVSLLDSQPAANDALAGCESFEQKRTAIGAALARGFSVTLNVVLHRHNLDRIDEIIELACQWGVAKIELAHVQYTGWAFYNRQALLPSRKQVEHATAVVELARSRVAGRLAILHVLPDYFQMYPKACLHGWGKAFLTVAPDGAVLPCQAAREIRVLDFPNVREASLAAIWFDSAVFNQFRGDAWMREPCRSCDRREIDYGGCRCQAYLLTGDISATDPVCHLSPHRSIVDRALDTPAQDVSALKLRSYSQQVLGQA